jgi:glycosyltransferase involved in cell wall biosynthesis
LVWVGNHVDQAYLDEVRKLAAELDVAFEPRVLVADDELLDLLSSASAMIYAPRLEPFGLAPLEAGACEVPVVAEGGVRETVQNGINGLLVDANPGALADAITHILEDPILARRLGTGGHAKVKSFWSTEAATGRLIEAFEDTLVASQQNHKGIPKELHR